MAEVGVRSRPEPSTEDETAGVRVHGARRSFGDVQALAGVDLTVAQGEVLGVVGPSGCGKSTLLELVAGLQEPGDGTVAAMGATAAADRGRACALMPQRDGLLAWRDALDNAALALECQGVPGARRASGRDRCFIASACRSSCTPARASCRAACASEWPSCARCCPAGRCSCWTSPSPRWTPSPARRCSSGWPTRWPTSRAR